MQNLNDFDQEVSTGWDIHASLDSTLGQDQTASLFIYMLQLILFAEDSEVYMNTSPGVCCWHLEIWLFM